MPGWLEKLLLVRPARGKYTESRTQEEHTKFGRKAATRRIDVRILKGSDGNLKVQRRRNTTKMSTSTDCVDDRRLKFTLACK
jgi:hypothetical protein